MALIFVILSSFCNACQDPYQLLRSLMTLFLLLNYFYLCMNINSFFIFEFSFYSVIQDPDFIAIFIALVPVLVQLYLYRLADRMQK